MKNWFAPLFFVLLTLTQHAHGVASLSFMIEPLFSQASKKAPWEPGEIVGVTQVIFLDLGPIAVYTKFLGATDDGYYIFQEFYLENDQQFSAPVLVAIPAQCRSSDNQECPILRLDELEITGPFVMWYKDGQIWAKGNYEHGIKQGLWNVWHENGQLWVQGNYQNGKACGIWLFWDDQGHLIREDSYEPCQSSQEMN